MEDLLQSYCGEIVTRAVPEIAVAFTPSEVISNSVAVMFTSTLAVVFRASQLK